MAHFAELDSNNVVKRVIVVSDKDTSDSNGIENESIGIAFLKSLFGQNTNWKQTSYNGKIKKNYAGVGGIYSEDLDAFLPPKPFPSWILDEENLIWNPPEPEPELTQEQIDSEMYYHWDEDKYVMEGSNGWVLLEKDLLE